MSAESKLKELGLTLPEAPKPVASYVPFVASGRMVYVSGQVPVAGGKPTIQGKVGAGGLSLEQGQDAARLCALNGLAQVKEAAGGNMDRVKRIVKVTGFVACMEGFHDIPKVVNGASDLLGQVFGEKGRHARSAVGVYELPLGVPVEVEMIVELE